MMKRSIKKILLVLICFFTLFGSVYAASATSLKELKDQLAELKANKNKIMQDQKELESKINAISGDLAEIATKIEECNTKIEAARLKIEELNVEIEEKNKEIESLLSFKQVSDGDNVYLEYIFGASSFTDFIYRSALVEQLTEYNDNLIDEMYALIEENKLLQEEMKNEIAKAEEETEKLNEKLKSYNLTMGNLDGDVRDVDAEIATKQREVDYFTTEYAKQGCAETDTMVSCIKYPYADGFIKPLVSASVTSNYGSRYHPTLHYWRMHYGIDLSASLNTKVYAAAAGKVSALTYKSSCGGNIVWIQHFIDGKEYSTVYQHLASFNVKVGDLVTAYDVIGYSGGGGYTIKANGGWDGCSTGGHLHFGIKVGWDNGYYVDPRNYINFPAKGSRFYSRF